MRPCAEVQQCAAVRAAVCGRAHCSVRSLRGKVCGSALGSVCMAVRGAVCGCPAVPAACGSPAVCGCATVYGSVSGRV
jgi:hypothetical protein